MSTRYPMFYPMLAFASGVALVAACQEEPSRAAEVLTAEPLRAEHAALPDPGAPPATALDALAKRYAAGLLADDAPIESELGEGERRDFLVVLRGGFCYRVLGAGDVGFDDLDLSLFDSAGVLLTEDPGQDRYPVLGMQGGICPTQAGSFRVQAHAYKGAGRFALRVFRTAQ